MMPGLCRMLFDTSLRNKIQISLTSFLAYFLMSAVISQMGVVTGPMSEAFGIGIGEAAALFSYLTTGLLIGSVIALFSFVPLGLRTNIIAACLLMLGALFGIWKVPTLTLLPAFFTVAGISCGLLMSAATVVITWCYAEKHRAQMLLVTDSFYSSAGVVTGLFAGYVIGKGAYWGTSYLLAIGATAIILLLALVSKYPADVAVADKTEAPSSPGRWPLSMILVGGVLFIYIASFILIYAWVPSYAANVFGASPEQGGVLVSRLFTGMLIGQIATFFLVFLIPLRWLVALLSAAALAATTGLWTVSSLPDLMMVMLVLGVLTGGLLKVLMALGTLTTARPSARMVSFLFFCTAIGSSIAPAFGAWIVSSFDEHTALMTVTIGYGLKFILLMTALGLMKYKK